MANHQYNLECGGGVWRGGAYFQPPVQGTAHPLYPDPNFIAFQNPLIIASAHPALLCYCYPNWLSPANCWNMAAAAAAGAPTPHRANQDRSNYAYRRQTYYNGMYYGGRNYVSCYSDHGTAASSSSSSMLMPMLPAAMGSITSGPYAMYNPNPNQEHQINNTHFNVPSDSIADHHNINDDEDRQFPSNFEEMLMNREWTTDESSDDEGGVVILESYSNVVHYQEDRGSGLPEDTISNYLKTRECTHQDPQSSNICVVCQDDICLKENDKELIATLDCGHEFHADCIKQWLKQKNICPLCKAEALPLASSVF